MMRQGAPFIPWYDSTMAVRKLAISIDAPLSDEIRKHAADQHQSVSRWISEAAKQQLRKENMAKFVADYEAEFGAITAADRVEAEKRWQESL